MTTAVFHPLTDIESLGPELWSQYNISQAFWSTIGWVRTFGPVTNLKDGTKFEYWKRVEKIGHLRLNLRKEIFPPNHSLIADAAVELARVKAHMNLDYHDHTKIEETDELLTYACDILSISHGHDYATYWSENVEKRMAELPIFNQLKATEIGTKLPFSVKD